MSVLVVKDLVKQFPIPRSKAVVSAVNGVSFSIDRGETLALVGESGSGKTTVARCIANLDVPTGGSIWLDGVELTSGRTRESRVARQRVQLVFQEPFDSLNPRMTVGASIAEPLMSRRVGKRERELRVAEARELVALPQASLDLYPHELTQGMQQRVGIARAIITKPSLLMLDEPTSALDPRARAQLVRLLNDLQQELGMAYLFITHDLNIARVMSHRVVVMYLGRVMEEGPTKALFTEQRHPYTRALLSAVLYADPTRRADSFELAGEIPSPIDLPHGCYLQSRCPLAMAECGQAVPPMQEVGDERLSACLRHDEVAGWDLAAAMMERG